MVAGTRRKAPAELAVRSDPGPSRLTCVVDGKTIVLSHGNLQALKMPMLKNLAINFGLKSSGRKGELIARICDFAGLEVEESAEEAKPRSSRKGGSSHAGPSSGRVGNADSYFPFHPGRPAMMTFPFCHCVCGGSPSVYPGNVLKCRHCQVNLHERCMRWDSQQAKQNNVSFSCPSCQMRQMDPFYPVSDILWLGYLHDGLPSASPVETNEGEPAVLLSMEASLTLMDFHQWRRSNREVIVRCVRLGVPANAAEEYAQEWPRTVDLTINANVESVFPPRPDHKRRDVPVIVTPYLKPHHNSVRIVCSNLVNADGTAPAFAMGFFVCETLDVPHLVDLVCKNSWETKAASLARVCRLLSDDVSDDDVTCVETNRRLKLSCPITLTRMKVPSRGRYCQHLQCFDLESFIEVTKSMKAFNNRWRCPECPLVLRTDTLIVDQYVEGIIKEAPETVEVVEVAKNGEWACITGQVELSGERSADEGGSAEEGDQQSDDESVAAAGLAKVKCEEGAGAPAGGSVQWSKPKAITFEDIDSDEEELVAPSVASSVVSCPVPAATAWPSIEAAPPVSPGESFAGRRPELVWTNGFAGSDQSGDAGLQRRAGSVDIATPALGSEAPGSSLAPGLSQLTELLLTALSRPPAGVGEGTAECIDLSPSTCSSTAATEPEDSSTGAAPPTSRDARRGASDERPPRKRRRFDSGTCRTADTVWDHNRDGDADDDQRGHGHPTGRGSDGGCLNGRHQDTNERTGADGTTHAAKRPCGRQCCSAPAQLLERMPEHIIGPLHDSEAMPPAMLPAMLDASGTGAVGALTGAMVNEPEVADALDCPTSNATVPLGTAGGGNQWQELLNLLLLPSDASTFGPRTDCSSIPSSAAPKLKDPTTSREPAPPMKQIVTPDSWTKSATPATIARGKFLPLQLPSQPFVPSAAYPVHLASSISDIPVIPGRGRTCFEPLPSAPRASPSAGAPMESFLTPPTAANRCTEQPPNLVLPENAVLLPAAMRGVSVRNPKRGETRTPQLVDLVRLEIPRGMKETAGENVREFLNSIAAAL